MNSTRTTRRSALTLGAAPLMSILTTAACIAPGRPAAGPVVAPTPTPALKPPLTYTALGASDAVGVGVENPERDSWVAVLGRRLPQPARTVNLGLPGIQLRQAIEVALPPALDAQPQLVTVWLVVNDVLAGIRLDEYRADLDRLLGRLRSGTKAYVAVGNIPNPLESVPYLGLQPAQRRALADTWNAAIAATVREHEAILVDLYHRWPLAENPTFIGPDGLHPTVAGYRSLADTFLAVLHEARVV